MQEGVFYQPAEHFNQPSMQFYVAPPPAFYYAPPGAPAPPGAGSHALWSWAGSWGSGPRQISRGMWGVCGGGPARGQGSPALPPPPLPLTVPPALCRLLPLLVQTRCAQSSSRVSQMT